jgi:hypothetical protein
LVRGTDGFAFVEEEKSIGGVFCWVDEGVLYRLIW